MELGANQLYKPISHFTQSPYQHLCAFTMF